jgi:hypothetical protein
MENIKLFRKLKEEEQKEINRYAEEALQLLRIKERETKSILMEMKSFIETIREEDKLMDNKTLEEYGYAFGSLFGDLICKEYNWEWYYVDSEEGVFFCVASEKQKACVVCHNYIYHILKGNHSNNFVLLFNMIQKQYPKDWHFMVLK